MTTINSMTGVVQFLQCCVAAAAVTPLFGGEFAIRDGDRVVIYGDSITSGVNNQVYGRYVEAYVRTRHPAWTTKFWNRGLGGSAANLDQFQRGCLLLKPDVVLFNMGMNDAGYTPAIAPGLRSFADRIAKVAAALKESDPKARLILISPILYENRACGELPFYPYVLRSYSLEEREMARRLQVGFIDLNRGYGESIGLADAVFPGSTRFSFDGIHPTAQGGHLFIACRILEGLGAGGDLALLDLDAAAARVVEAKSAKVEELLERNGVLSFSRTLDALPFPVVPETDGVSYRDRAVAMIVDVADTLNRDILRVRGLPAKAYSLAIDDKPVAEMAADELADGINLSRYFNTPDQEQAVAVSEAVGRKQILQSKAWQLGLDPKADPASLAAVEKEARLAEEAVAAIARPARHRFTLTPLDREVDRYARYEQLLEIAGPQTLTRGEDGTVRQEIKLSVKNLSLLRRRLEFLWTGTGVSPSTFVGELEGGEGSEFAFSVSLAADDNGPGLRLSHQPTDLSFPPIVQQYVPAFPPRLDVPRGAAVLADGDPAEFAASAVLDLERGMDPIVQQQRIGPGDFRPEARLQWSDEGLAVAVVVRDQDHVSHFTNDRLGWDDAVGVNAGRVNITLALTKNGPAILPSKATEAGVRFAVARRESETVYELVIPWTELGDRKPESGAEFPFGISVSDRDRDESYKIAHWSGTPNRPVLGAIRLSETK